MLIDEFKLLRTEKLADRTVTQVLIRYKGESEWKEFGWAIEDTDRGLDSKMSLERIEELKIKKITCIPTGRYLMKFTWSPKYNRMVLELINVPGFRGIRWHTGNNPDHTEGCICPGLILNAKTKTTSKSTEAIKWIEARMLEAQEAEHTVWCTVERAYAA